MAIPERLRGNKARANFLKVDSEIALTFSSIALEATDPEKRRRTIHTARRAYDAIVRLRENVDLTEAENDNLNVNLRRLKSELQRLGQSF
jgi:hypothetical protein